MCPHGPENLVLRVLAFSKARRHKEKSDMSQSKKPRWEMLVGFVFTSALVLCLAPLAGCAQSASTRERVTPLENARTLADVAPSQNDAPQEAASPIPKSAAQPPEPHQVIAQRLGEGLPEGLPQPTREQRQAIVEGQRTAQKWAKDFLVKDKSPRAAGNGVVVAAPEKRGTGVGETADFAQGCTRWLQVELSGQPELGRMPPWGNIDNAAASMGKANTALQGNELAQLARLCSATHFVSTAWQSNAARSRLTLQLWTVQQKKVDAPLSLAGSQAQILAALPDAARKIAALLGVTQPAVTALKIAPDEMAFLGRVEWRSPRVSEYSLSPDAVRLESLTEKTPLAGILWCYANLHVSLEPQWRHVAGAMVRLAPRHPLVFASLSLRAAQYTKPYRKSIEALRRRFPRNSLLEVEEMSWREYRGDTEGRAAAATRRVALVPDDTLAWAQLADAYAAKAEKIRRNRALGALSSAQQKQVFALYQLELMSALESTRLNPKSSSGWKSLLHAAMLAGDPALGDAALWTGLPLSWRNRERYRTGYSFYDRGLWFYQPQWYDDATRLRKIGKLIAQDETMFLWLGRSLQNALFATPFTEEHDAMLSAFFEQCDWMMKTQPQNGFVYVMCVDRALDIGDYKKAADAYEKWLAVAPDNYAAIVGYAELIRRHQPRIQRRSYAFMEELFRKAMKRSPNSALLALSLGRYQRDVSRDFGRAASQLRRAMTLDPYDSQPAMELAIAYWSLKNDEANATRLFEEAARRDPNNSRLQWQWAWELKKRGKTAEAQKHARRAAQLGEVNVAAFGIQ